MSDGDEGRPYDAPGAVVVDDMLPTRQEGGKLEEVVYTKGEKARTTELMVASVFATPYI